MSSAEASSPGSCSCAARRCAHRSAPRGDGRPAHSVPSIRRAITCGPSLNSLLYERTRLAPAASAALRSSTSSCWRDAPGRWHPRLAAAPHRLDAVVGAAAQVDDGKRRINRRRRRARHDRLRTRRSLDRRAQARRPDQVVGQDGHTVEARALVKSLSAPSPRSLCSIAKHGARAADRYRARRHLAPAATASGPLFAKPAYAAGVDWLTLAGVALPVRRGRVVGVAADLARLSDARCATCRRRRILVLILLGIFFVGNSGTYFAGLQYLSASLSALIVYMYPAIVAVLTIRFGRRLEGRRAWGALALATAGVVLAVGGIDPTKPRRADRPRADDLRRRSSTRSGSCSPAGSPASAAARIGETADGRSPPHDSELDRGGARRSADSRGHAHARRPWRGGYGHSQSHNPVLPSQIPTDAWLPLVGVGIVSTAIALQAFYAGARRIGAAQASLVSTVEPIYTIILASLLFGETTDADPARWWSAGDHQACSSPSPGQFARPVHPDLAARRAT